MVRLREVIRAGSLLLGLIIICSAAPSQARASETSAEPRAHAQAQVQLIVLAADAIAAPSLTHAGELLTDLPPNLRVPRDLRPALEQALQRSPTFQRQMRTLLHTQRVRMSVGYGGLRGMKLFQAHSTVTHHEYGALIVETQLFAPADMVELVAHEVEHVCEQIEGVDLRALAARRDSGVYDMGGHYETQRAILAGHRVSREIQGLPTTNEQMTHVTY